MTPSRARRTHRWPVQLFAVVGLAAGLFGCAAPPARTDPETTKPTPAPAPVPVPVVVPEPAPAPPAVTAETMQAAQRIAQAVIEMLEAGNEEQATAELNRALQNDPNNKLALSLMRQIQADPQATLGRESFAYRVQPGDTISRIAQRFLGDVQQFYILARYNDLRVPRQLQVGQTLKVPGKAPPPTPAAPATAAPSKPGAPTPPSAAPPSATTTPAVPTVDPAAAAEREQAAKLAAKVATATRAAKAAYARQDLVAALRHWDTVLELDPSNGNAKIERQRAADLKARLDRLK